MRSPFNNNQQLNRRGGFRDDLELLVIISLNPPSLNQTDNLSNKPALPTNFATQNQMRLIWDYLSKQQIILPH
jgi:hypothetical protein